MDRSPVAVTRPLCRCRVVRAGRLDRGPAALDLSEQNRCATNGDGIARPKRPAPQLRHRALEMSIMLTRLLRATLPAVLAGTFGLQPAHADIYTWVDASGGVNVSNLAPPDGVRITNVIVASPPKTTTHDDDREAARDAEVQALTKRVRQLEGDVESQGSGSNYWYYCRDPAGYYPDAQTCPSGWLQVVPNRTADPTPGAGQ
jgi:uncharacterized protein DUF4124